MIDVTQIQSVTEVGRPMIYLVRHGQTRFNLEQRHHGHVDSPLTDLGRMQSRRAGEALAASIHPQDAVIFSSPLGRALQTAMIIADVVAIEKSIIVDPDLMEIGIAPCAASPIILQSRVSSYPMAFPGTFFRLFTSVWPLSRHFTLKHHRTRSSA
jgi:hypothetical protein